MFWLKRNGTFTLSPLTTSFPMNCLRPCCVSAQLPQQAAATQVEEGGGWSGWLEGRDHGGGKGKAARKRFHLMFQSHWLFHCFLQPWQAPQQQQQQGAETIFKHSSLEIVLGPRLLVKKSFFCQYCTRYLPAWLKSQSCPQLKTISTYWSKVLWSTP